MYNATKFPFCQGKNDYSDMNEKSHAKRVMNKKEAGREIRWDVWLAAGKSNTEAKIKRLTSK